MRIRRSRMSKFISEISVLGRPSRVTRKRRLLYESLETRRVLANFEVTSLLDTTDANDGVLTLREAILSANATAGDPDTITFESSLSGTIVLTQSQLEVTDSLTITGNGATSTIVDAKQQSRVFNITTTGDVEFNNLTITGGLTSVAPTAGGGILSQSSSSTLTITGSQIIGNRTTSLDSGGGGISVNGNLILINSTVANNSTSGANSHGGGIASARTGNIRIENSTISGNSVLGTSGIGGGGIYFDDGDVTIQNSTITGNTAPIGGGIGIFADNAGESLSIGNSIIAGNTATTNPDFTAPGTPANNLIVSYSLIGNNEGTTLAASTVGNLIGTPAEVINPRLIPLQLNGGSTLTHMLFLGSPAMDAGEIGFSRNPDEDQRGGPFRRVANGRLDMGAVELQVTDPSLLVVTTTNDELDYSNSDVSLREAINTANGALSDTTITFADNVSGTINLTLGQLDISKGVTINGPGQTLLTIDANQRSRVVNVVDGTANNVTLRGLTITGGQSLGDNSSILGATLGGGGVSFGSTGTLALDAVTVSNNITQGSNAIGGGVYSARGSILLTASTVSGNRALGNGAFAVGGGLATVSGSVTLFNSTVSGNSTEDAGGNGGGIYSYYGDISLTGSTVSANRVEAADLINGNFSPNGGGISARRGNITLTNSTVSGNSVTNPNAGGGGVAAFTGDITLVNSTLTNNRAIGTASEGGGVSSSNGKLTIHNSIVAANSATINPDFTAPSSPATNLEVRASLIGNNQGTSLSASASGDANGNRIGAPGAIINPLLGPLNLNFGPTQTHALLTGSPAINAGNNALIPSGLVTDQRGDSFVRQNGIVDIGAFELQSLDPSFFNVTTTNDEFDYSNNDVSLREAIHSANGSLGVENIFFSDGVTGEITLTLGELRIFDSITIIGPGQSLLSINANGQSRVLNITSQTAIDVTLSGLTITGGQTTGDNTSFVDPSFSGAGILFVSTGSLRLGEVTVSNNSTQGASTIGGGIFSPLGSVLAASSSFSGNSASGTNAVGGGIVTFTSPVFLIDSTVTGNVAVNRAGGIYSSSGPISLTGSTVSDNRVDAPVTGSGGGIYSQTGAVTLTGSTVSGNVVTGPNASGGGISSFSSAVTLTNSTVSGNQTSGANANGGGVHVLGGRVFALNSTITRNNASTSGGGLTMGSSDPSSQNLSIVNSIVAGNTAGSNPDFTAPSLLAANLSVVHSLIGNNTGTTLTASATADANGNFIGISATPINPMLGPLSLNGGKTQSHALLAGSPAINAGRNSAAVTLVNNVVTPIDNDQRGVPFLRVANTTVDMGSFELQTFDPSFFIVTTTNDELDFTNIDVSLREAIVTANGQAGPNTISFAEDVFDTITLTQGELSISKSLTITGPGQSVLKIDANNQSRVFNVSGDSGPAAVDLAITGLTITGGQTIGNNAFAAGDNRFSGGGIRFISTGNLTLTDSAVSGNRTLGSLAAGGGIYSPTGNVILSGSTIADNSTAGFFAPGGGVLVAAGAVTATSSTISGNVTTGDNSSGGGLFTVTGDVSLVNSTVSGNQTTGLDSDGGGLLVNNSLVRIVNSTLTGNQAQRAGGGLMTVANAANKTLTIHNSIIAGNIAPTSADFTAPTTPATNLDARNSLIGDNAGTSLAPTTTINGNRIGTTAAPINAMLGPLNFNGGTTKTHALLTGSPAIDAASNALAVNPGNVALTFDQRGFPFFRQPATTFDIGAFEFQPPLNPFFFNVTTTNDELNEDSQISLREAINFANGNPGRDTITFASFPDSAFAFLFNVAGVINLSLGELPVTESLTINGLGQSVTAIDANQRSRVFNVFGDSIVDLTINGLTITGGQTTGDSSFLGDVDAFNGGGIRFVSNGTLTIADSTVSGNSTTGTSAGGGGIFSSAGAVNLVRSTVANNSTSEFGAFGGGIFTRNGAVTLTNSTISGNTTSGANSSGGGLFTYVGDLSLINSTVSGNRVTGTNSDGGGLQFYASLVTLVNSTITNNEASRAGGGLNVFANPSNEKLTIHNSIIAANTAVTNPDFTAPFSPATNLEVRSSLIGDNTGTSLAPTTTVNGNKIGLSTAKFDPLLAPLALRGGATLTHALLTGSLAINAGSNALAVNNATPLATDQRGAPFNRIADTMVDIGAFELQSPFTSPFIVNTTNDELDYTNSSLSLREAINNANGNPGEDNILFDPDVFGIAQTINLSLGELGIGESMAITAPSGTTLVIDANRRSRVFNVIGGGVLGGNVIDVAFFGLTITGGQTTGSNRNSDNVFSGGGIRFDSNGSLNLIDTVVSNSRTTGESANGGGIFVNGGALSLRNSSITGNRVEGTGAGGGGIHTRGGRVRITNSSVTKNVASGNAGFGGGIVSLTDSTTLSGSTVAENSTTGADSVGGGIVSAFSDLALTNSTVSGNSSPGFGGGIVSLYAPVSLVNSTITGNRSLNGPGSGGVFLLNTTFNPALTIRNSIVAGNTVAAGSTGPDLLPDPDAALTVEFSLIGDNTGTTLPPAPTPNNLGNVVGTAIAKIDPLLAPLANNGGNVSTHALLTGSPAINGGLNSLFFNDGTALANDQRGAPFNRIANATVDIGAFESQALAPSSFIVTTTGDELDYTNTVVSLREAINSANGNAGVDAITFAAGVTGRITLTQGELPITQSVTITGPGANLLAIDANQKSRVLNILGGTAIDVAISGLTITGGRASGNNFDPFDGEFSGGGIRFDSSGTLSLTSANVSGNSTTGFFAFGGGIFAFGGGIFAFGGAGGVGGAVTATNSTVSGNSTAGFSSAGGGIAILAGALTLNNSTVSGNTTTGTQASGGGVLSYLSSVALTNSTITNNRTTGDNADGGGISIIDPQSNTPTPLTIRNSIVAGNTVASSSSGPDFLPDPQSVLTVEFSLIGDNTDTTLTASATPDANGNLIGTSAAKINPLLGPLQNNGGPTQTHSLLTDSSAINAGSNPLAVDASGNALTTDQRGPGFPRIGISTVDIGSFESLANAFDFGDAPATFPVTLAQNGARHNIGNLFLGSSVNAETNGTPSSNADGDDADDGVVTIVSIVATAATTTTSSFNVIASAAGKLDAWIDFNRDGNWSTNEKIFDSVDVTAGTNLLSFTVPAGASPGQAGARFRLSSAGTLLPTGVADDGEVEDYMATIINGDAANDVFVDLAAPEMRLRVDTGAIVVSTAQTELFRAPLAAIEKLSLQGFETDNSLTIDQSNGFAVPMFRLELDGGGGDNTLSIQGDGGTIDLTNSAFRFRTLDLSSSDANTVIIDSDTVADLSPAGPLQIFGGNRDVIELTDAANWRLAEPITRDGRFLLTANNSESGGSESIEADWFRPWQNFVKRSDVDNDGRVQASDALKIINELARRSVSDEVTELLNDPLSVAPWPNRYFDQNGDGKVTALDALRIVNDLARQAGNTQASEGEVANQPAQVSLLVAPSAAEVDRSDRELLAPETINSGRHPMVLVSTAASQGYSHSDQVERSFTERGRLRQRDTDELLSDVAFLDALFNSLSFRLG